LALVFIAAQFALILGLPVPSSVLWSLVAMAGAGTVLSYAIVAEYFPKELTGRANGALNVFHFGWAFVLQYAIGLVLQQWPSQGGHYPIIAYQVALSFNLGLQIAALAWFELADLPIVRILSRPFAQLPIANRPTHTDATR
jgi:MFS family permease